jgi:hypothetical protein
MKITVSLLRKVLDQLPPSPYERPHLSVPVLQSPTEGEINTSLKDPYEDLKIARFNFVWDYDDKEWLFDGITYDRLT